MSTAKKLPNKKRAWPGVKKVTHKNGTEAFQVDARYQGKGERLFFTTRIEAETAAEQLRIRRKNEGASAFTMTAGDRLDAERSLQLLRPHDVTLQDVTRFYLKHAKFVKKDVLLRDAAQEYLTTLAANGASKYNVKGQRSFLSRIEKFFHGAKLVDITTPMLENWTATLADKVTPITRNSYKRDLRRFFNFTLRREYLLDNPAVKMEVVKEIETRIGILDVGQSTRLLEGCSDDFLPAIALGLFAGLRPISEIVLLDWSSINFNTKLISIEATRTKTARHRYVKMTDNLIEWLLPYKRAKGPVSPCAPDASVPSVSIYGRRLIQARLKAAITEWPQDVLRHTYGSMHLAKFRDAADTSLEMGHRTSHMLFRHYRARVTPEEAEAFWNIRPGRENNVCRCSPRLEICRPVQYLPRVASTTRGPSPTEANEAMPYGSARGVKEALDAFLAQRDPKQAKANQKNSPGARRNLNYLRLLPDIVILAELLRRERLERKRENTRERQQRHRGKVAREKRAASQ